jgi:nucleotide-binding universal stress UspA family protein
MTTVLAAIDDSTAAAPVLAVGQAMAALLGTALVAVHVREGDKRTAVDVAEQVNVPVRVVDGLPVEAIAEAAADTSVRMVVVGARGQPAGPRPAGHVAVALAERIDKPVLVVPPDITAAQGPRPIRRALIPLEGSAESTEAIAASLRDLAAAGVELVGVHVFDTTTVPRFWDRPGHTEQAWGAEFLSRWCTEPGVDLHLRRGSPPTTIVDIAGREQVDLIALGWAQDLGPGHADVVRAVLTHAPTPVLLVPVRPARGRRGQ